MLQYKSWGNCQEFC